MIEPRLFAFSTDLKYDQHALVATCSKMLCCVKRTVNRVMLCHYQTTDYRVVLCHFDRTDDRVVLYVQVPVGKGA